LLRPRRRGLASINSEVRDGIAPAADGLALTSTGPSSTAPAGRRHYRLIALIIACAMFMEQMDATVLTTALPTMARDFGAPVTELSSALTAYLLALAIFIPASGAMADRYGAKTVFRLAILLFLAGSLLCGQAHSLPLLVPARFLQGVGGAMMIPVGRLVLMRSVAKEDLVDAMSWLLVPAMIGPILGPPLGGFIVTYLNWRWIFYLNVPMATLGVILVSRYFEQFRREDPPPFDTVGFVMSGVSLGCLLFGLEMLTRSDQYRQAAGLLAVGIAAGALYVRHAVRRPHPILDLSLLRVETFRLSVIAGSLSRIMQGAGPFLLPLMLQVGFGLSAVVSGSITLAGAIGSFTMKGLAPRLLKRFGFRHILIVNGLAGSAGYALCGFFRPGWPPALIFGVLAACGFCMSLQFTAYNTIAYDEIPSERMSAATSFYATFQQLMLSLGICVGAGALHAAMLAARQATPGLAQFTFAFLVVTSISALATVWHMRFSPTAGDELSGRRPSRA